jgi:DNA-binding GntR family transcriptional regulator
MGPLMADIKSPIDSRKKADNLAAQIYAQLKADIFDFQLLPGDKFSEGDIAARMNVSRTPVRQALFWLQHEGYVDVHFRSGWQIRTFDYKYFEDLFEVRVMMETSAIEQLIRLDLASRLDCLRQTWCVPQSEYLEDAAVVVSLDEAFHAHIVAAVGNVEMVRIHEDLTERIRIIRRLDFTKAPRIDATYREHAEILDAISAGDTAQAQRLICAHIAQSRAEIKRITLYMLQTARTHFGKRERA